MGWSWSTWSSLWRSLVVLWKMISAVHLDRRSGWRWQRNSSPFQILMAANHLQPCKLYNNIEKRVKKGTTSVVCIYVAIFCFYCNLQVLLSEGETILGMLLAFYLVTAKRCIKKVAEFIHFVPVSSSLSVYNLYLSSMIFFQLTLGLWECGKVCLFKENDCTICTGCWWHWQRTTSFPSSRGKNPLWSDSAPGNSDSAAGDILHHQHEVSSQL